MRDCILICAGELDTAFTPYAGYVIAVDGGYAAALARGITPDLSIGDFDSLGYIPDIRAAVLPCEKDDTDTLAALKHGLSMGFQSFHIYGGMGGRLDHTLANIQCLAYLARRGARGYLHGGGSTVTLIKDGYLALDAAPSGIVSVFSHTDVAHSVSEFGLKYPLHNATLTNDTPLGISNELIGRPARVEVGTGELVVVYPDE